MQPFTYLAELCRIIPRMLFCTHTIQVSFSSYDLTKTYTSEGSTINHTYIGEAPFESSWSCSVQQEDVAYMFFGFRDIQDHNETHVYNISKLVITVVVAILATLENLIMY